MSPQLTQATISSVGSAIAPTDASIPISIPTIRATLRPDEDFEYNSTYMREICKASCIQTDDGECTSRVGQRAHQEHFCWKDRTAKRSHEFSLLVLNEPSSIPDELDDTAPEVHDEPLKSFSLVATAIFNNKPIDAETQNKADDCDRQFVSMFHLNDSYVKTLAKDKATQKEGARSIAITEWNENVRRTRNEIVDIATSHGAEIDEREATLKQLNTDVELQLNIRNNLWAEKAKDGAEFLDSEWLEGIEYPVDQAEKKADTLTYKLIEEKNAFERKLSDLEFYCDYLPTAYKKHTPRGPRHKRATPEGRTKLRAEKAALRAERAAKKQTSEAREDGEGQDIRSDASYSRDDEKDFLSTKELYDRDGYEISQAGHTGEESGSLV